MPGTWFQRQAPATRAITVLVVVLALLVVFGIVLGNRLAAVVAAGAGLAAWGATEWAMRRRAR